MSEGKMVSRRRFLILAGGSVAAGALVCTGAGLAAGRQPEIEFPTLSCGTEGKVEGRILVAYASWCGSTGEVAEAISEELCQAGLAVDVRNVKDVKDLRGYVAVVLGCPARCGKSMPAAVKFAEQHRAELRSMPVAYFHVGVTMKEDTPQNRELAAACLKSLCDVREPVSMGLFAGKVDLDKMGFPFKQVLSFVKEGCMAPGDFRDWDAIRAWARSLVAEMAPAVAA